MRRAKGSRLLLVLKDCTRQGETRASSCAVPLRVPSGLCGRSSMHGWTEVGTTSSRIISFLPAVTPTNLVTTSTLFQKGFACGKDSDEGEGAAAVPADSVDSKKRDAALKEAADSGGMSGLLGVVKEGGQHFSEQNVVASFANLAKLGVEKSDGQLESLYKEAPFLTLVDMVIRGVGRFSDKQLLSILGDCVKLGYDDDMLVDHVTAQLLQHMGSLEAAQLLDLASSLAEAQNTPSVVLFDAIQVRAEELGDKLTDAMKKELQNAFTALGYQRHSDAVGNL